MQTPIDEERAAPPATAEPPPSSTRSTLRMARRVGVAVVGSAVLGVGVVLLVTPGPAFVVIPIGLAILSLEFEWARRWLRKVKEHIGNALPSRDKRRAPAP